ncbi:hypothetical protein J8L86_14650 [Shewanella sp. MMG014]|uniref:hypothetical protein n=1 Tax=Shewanella sp. MMG014 TaxID=2822691 RepID=UPI001B387AE9|nr:hypothetical protein [Shewanella sp. MMG014]MBQ4891093.1 hypothetical protein [Shewanella sp. MMG014]
MNSIDYSKYSTDELLDVKENIDPNTANYGVLISELSNRQDEINEKREQEKAKAFSLAESRVKVIGYFQVTAAVAILFFYITSIFDGSVSLLSTAASIFVIALNLIAGLTAIKEMYKYYWVSILNQSLQVPNIVIGSISATYSGLGGIYTYINWNPEFLFGMTASFSPGFIFNEYTEKLQTQTISIDFLAIIFILALVTVSDAQSTSIKQN